MSLLMTLLALFSVSVVSAAAATCLRRPGRRRSKKASALVLSHLGDHCCSTQEAIQAATGLSAPHTLSVIEELRARGLVERRVDRRVPSVLQHHLVKRGAGAERCHAPAVFEPPSAYTGVPAGPAADGRAPLSYAGE
ncbi:hypothetical protein KBZ94_40190 [Streptomyces sp. RM72]|uniref:hypothetical protein n=1 Tax=Streptomyces sp. RM72 TaxID=1115510 RepID=UPI001B3886BA|nr:hypothetical protein [Streptomyces sp. RM72]MBQ0891066.1 hypothetical protein [Streptomyces sp. RM72]